MRQLLSAVIDDRELVVTRRLADGADMPVGAWISGDPADFAAAIALGDGNSKVLFEPPPILAQERCRTRDHEPQARQGFGVQRIVAVEQHVDRGRIAGGDCRAMLRDVLEKPAARELASQDQRSAPAERRQRAQNLGRTPIERPKIIDAIVGGHAQSVRGRLDIGEQLAKCQYHAFRPVAGAGGEQDAGIVLRPCTR